MASLPLVLILLLGGGLSLPPAAQAEPPPVAQQQPSREARLAMLAARVRAAVAAERAAVARLLPDVSRAPAEAWVRVLEARRETKAASEALMAAVQADPAAVEDGQDAAWTGAGSGWVQLERMRRDLDQARTSGGGQVQPLREWDAATAAMLQAMDRLLAYIAAGGKVQKASGPAGLTPSRDGPAAPPGRGWVPSFTGSLAAGGGLAALAGTIFFFAQRWGRERYRSQGSRRKRCALPSSLVLASGTLLAGQTINLSESGAAVRLEGPPPVLRKRSKLTLTLRKVGALPCRVVVCSEGVVRLRFDRLGTAEAAALKALVASLPETPLPAARPAPQTPGSRLPV